MKILCGHLGEPGKGLQCQESRMSRTCQASFPLNSLLSFSSCQLWHGTQHLNFFGWISDSYFSMNVFMRNFLQGSSFEDKREEGIVQTPGWWLGTRNVTKILPTSGSTTKLMWPSIQLTSFISCENLRW